MITKVKNIYTKSKDICIKVKDIYIIVDIIYKAICLKNLIYLLICSMKSYILSKEEIIFKIIPNKLQLFFYRKIIFYI
jgi:hypothetical protein